MRPYVKPHCALGWEQTFQVHNKGTIREEGYEEVAQKEQN